MDGRFEGRVVVVTGAAGQIGSACAERFEREGSLVARGAPGAIVNLTSVSGVVADAESVAYEASKGAVTMATKGMAIALAPHGIRVNAVGPGSMAKFQEREPRDPYDLDDYERRRIPLGRL